MKIITTQKNIRNTNVNLSSHSRQLGGGIISNIKNRLIKKYLDSRPKIVNDFIKSNGNDIISRIKICRSPIMPIFEKIVNVLSLGMLKKMMKKQDYDKLFHLYVILYFSNGKSLRIEKNQRMFIYKNPTIPAGTDVVDIKIFSRDLNFSSFILAPEKNDFKNLYRYDAFQYNCQNYIRRLLKANNIIGHDKFIMQNVQELAPGIVKRIAQGVTDIAGLIDYKIRGGDYFGYGMSNSIESYNSILNGF